MIKATTERDSIIKGIRSETSVCLHCTRSFVTVTTCFDQRFSEKVLRFNELNPNGLNLCEGRIFNSGDFLIWHT